MFIAHGPASRWVSRWFGDLQVHPASFWMQSEDKTLRLVNHMWHILVREQGNEKINSEIADWILKRA